MSDERGTTYVSRRSVRDTAATALLPKVRAVVAKLPQREDRPRVERPRRTSTRSPRPYGVASVVAAVGAVATGLLVTVIPVLLVWAFAARADGTAQEAAFTGADVWLVAHHVPIEVSGSPLGLLPLGLIAVPVLLLRLSTTWAARTLSPGDLGDVGLLSVSVAAVYGLLGGLVAAYLEGHEGAR